MTSCSLPPGYRIRKAKFTDLPQLVLQVFESKSFVAYLEMKNWFFFILAIAAFVGYQFSFNVLILTILTFTISWLHSLYSQTWLVENNNQIIASARFNIYISRLNNLYVKPQYRRRGIASYLIKYLQKKFNKTIFIICDAKLVQYGVNKPSIKQLRLCPYMST